ncbi:amino acid adenylation domain-containing protein [Rhodococcus pyridinivorans]
MPQILAGAVEQNPGGTALSAEGRHLSYAALDTLSSRIARFLISRGVGPETFVAIGIRRSFESVIAVWAVAKTGAAFLPVDPNYPQDRIQHMLTDSGAVLGLTTAAHRDALPSTTEWVVLDDPDVAATVDGQSGEPVSYAERNAPLRAENAAYVIYTSGSTGRPKGVVVTQAGLASFSIEQRERYQVGTDARTLHFASPSFDASVLELLLAFGAGATMVIAPPDLYGGSELREFLLRERVTHAFITPAALATVNPDGLDTLSVVVVGGEACPPELVERWASGRRFHNGYGPTETTIMTNISAALAPGEQITIGPPIRNTASWVLDAQLRRVPIGVVGELYLSGPELARGYHNRVALTAERFIANPYANPGERMYRTGDLVRWTESGDIVYVGRSDFQVKVRGFRIELGEIDAVLSSHEKVDFAVTVGHTGAAGVTSLVAYVLPVDSTDVDVDVFRGYAQQSLPAHMVPSTIMVLDTIPLTPNGKLDRAALPEPVFEAREFRAPVTPMHMIVAETFEEVLGLDRVGLDDDFFALGGNSLLATQVAARLGQALGSQVPVRVLFEAGTVEALAARVEKPGNVMQTPLVAQQRPERVPLSFAQQRMWFLNRFDTESAVNNIPMAIRLSGDLDVPALRSAIGDVLQRHESLRTVYPEFDGVGYQQVVSADQVPVDLEPVVAREDDVLEAVARFVGAGFDVTREVPVRARLYRIADTAADHVLVFVVHHIAGDGSSMGPLSRDVMIAYEARRRGETPAWSPLPVQYADYAIWQRAVLGSEDDPQSVIARQIAFWKEGLAGLPEQLDLPSDRPRPAVASGRGAGFVVDVDPNLHAALHDLARGRNATLFMVIHATLATLLSRLSGTSDIAIGTPVAGRGERELDDVIGMFVNTLALRTEVDPSAPFTELLDRAREVDLAAFGHADVPFERLVEVLNPERSQARHPLFQVALFFQNFTSTMFELPGLRIGPVDPGTTLARFDLQLTVGEIASDRGDFEGLQIEFAYATDLFEERTVRGFAGRFLRLLEAVVAEPAVAVGDIELMSPAERQCLLERWNATDRSVEDRLLLDGFYEQVIATPDAVALVFEAEELTYARLASRANRLARKLVSMGVGPERLVVLAMRRQVDLVVAMYAVLAAGGAYVPVDPDHPAERTRHVLESARPVVVLSTSRDEFETPGDETVFRIDEADLSEYADGPLSDAERIAPLRASNTAYVIYTSGSTGKPKGVAVAHSAIVNQMEWMRHEYGFGQKDIYLQKTATTFDVSLWGFFLPLRTGGRLILATPDGHRDPAYIARTIAENQVTLTDFVPSMLSVFGANASASELPSLRDVFVIGEALTRETVRDFARVSDAPLHNLYGPTEAAVSITYRRTDGREQFASSVPIGVPQWNSKVFVLDARLRPVPVGVAGELYLAGVQLARAYHGRPDLTSERFVANPLASGERMYRTGDLVRWTANGELEYIGRTDFQVKFRGQRIELGEIESALSGCEGISQAVAAVKSSDFGEQLLGYVVGRPGREPDASSLRDAMRSVLPSYMVPSQVVVLDELPLNASGKVDRKRLPEPTFESKEFRAPVTPVQHVVADTIAEVLGKTRVGLDDDFFELGGNSLNATQVVARIGRALDVQVPVRVLFEAPEVEVLAARVEAHTELGREQLVVQKRPAEVPLSYAQRRMWFINQFDPESAAYNVPLAVRLVGRLDVVALRRAVKDVLERHESLRTVYPSLDDGPVQVVVPAADIPIDLDPVAVEESELLLSVSESIRGGFDVAGAVPLRMRLFHIVRTDTHSDEFVLVVVVHHIAADGSSMAPLVRDVMVAYESRCRGEVPGWAPLQVQYADFALWQRQILGSEDDPESLISRQVGYWRDTLAGVPEVLSLPVDRPRPAVQSFRGATVPFEVPADVHRRLVGVARERGATVFMAVHAALAVLLSRLSGSNDVAVGTPIAGRGERELDDLVGMFVNTLVLRTQVDPSVSFADLLEHARAVDVAAFGHADVPFERLVEELAPARSTAHSPLFQVLLVFQNFARTTFALPDLRVEALDADLATARFDLQVGLSEEFDSSGDPAGIAGAWTYATDLFDESTVVSFAERFVRILEAVTADVSVVVGDVELLVPEERASVLGSWVDTGHDLPRVGTLVDLFDGQVQRSPELPAVVFDGDVLSYGEFAARVNRLGRYLISVGVGPESRVAVAMRRSVDLVVAVHAVLAAGGAYVPVDPDHPAERTSYVLESSEPVLVLTTVRDGFTAACPVVAIDELDVSGYSAGVISDVERLAVLRPENTAYVIYTSGSTGRPKGVALPHAATVNQLLWAQDRYPLGTDDVVLLKTPFTFDVSVWELFWTLQTGARLVVAEPDGHRDPEYLARVIGEQQVTTVHFVPSMLAAFLSATVDSVWSSLRRVFVAGEALPMELVRRFAAVAGDTELHNWYGPAEVEVVTAWAADPDAAVAPIGSPVWNTRTLVLDGRLNPVPVGVAGELYLAGAQVARGYLGRTDLTAERFVANPFASGERMYRTGDLVRWTSSGELEYLGRTDFQVKLRGQRIELGEIEAALQTVPGVGQAVVVLHSDPQVGDRLVGYVAGIVAPGDVIDAVRSVLPSYMVPSQVVVLDELPLNASGKLDRRALPEPVFEVVEFRAPVTPVEQTVAAVFGEVLGLERVGLDDDFFALGGNSLSATQVVSRIGAALDTPIPVRVLFEESTVEGLAARVSEHAGAGGRVPLVAQVRPDRVPLSFAQQRMWFINQFDTASPVYNVPLAIRLSGALDVTALSNAVADVIDRHESLRTVYPAGPEGPAQVVMPVTAVRSDLSPVPVPQAEVSARVGDVISAGFDVSVETPVRARLFRVANSVDEFVLVVVVHHIAADGSSMAPLVRDVMVAYESRCRGEVPGWAPLQVQYADFALWQRQILGSEDDPESLISRQVGYWRDTLAGVPEVLSLPVDRPRPAVQSFRGATVPFEVPADVHRRLVGVARERGATVFMAVHAALAVLLSRLSGSNDVAVGTPIAGRGERELDDLVGMFVNTLVLRTQVDPSVSFADLLEHARAVDVAAFGHADVPFERLVEELAPARSTAHSPLFQVLLVFQNFAQRTFELPGLTVAGVDAELDTAKFDLQITAVERFDAAGAPAGMSVAWTYATDLFDESTVVSFAERFVRILEAVTADVSVVVGDVELLVPEERASVLGSWVDTGHDLPRVGTLVDLFDGQVQRSPELPAVVFDGDVLSYGEFAARVNRLGRYLISVGVGPESRVAVAMRRSVDLVVAVHAVLAAGGAYVPVDPDHPAERTSYVLESSEPVLVLTTVRDGFTAACPVVAIDELDVSGYSAGVISDVERLAVLRPENTAYVIYTSGSTGRPKGVALPHAATVNQLLWAQDRYPLGTDDVVLLKTPFTFDVSVWELFWTLQTGARLVVAEPDGHRDPEYLARVIGEQQVTTVHFVPSMLAAFLSATVDSVWSSLRRVFVAGEALPMELVRRFAAVAGDTELHNWYGPAEVEVVTAWAADPDAAVAPIGSPVWNTRTLVLDGRLNPVPVGVAGELYLAGAQVARGYLGRTDLTAERFVANPFASGERMYRTGDLVRWTSSGELEYLGRTDFQVKLRGQRIELGEIEAALQTVPGVGQAVVVLHSDPQVGDRLVGYVAGIVAPGDVIDAVRSVLPSYMVPSQVVVLDELPLNASGKLDRRALPEPVFEVVEFRAPVTPVEQTVAAVFGEVLGLERVGLDDDFFALGGNSLSATQVVSRIGAALDTPIPVHLLFSDPTVAGLVRQVRSGATGDKSFSSVLPLREDAGSAPLFFIHPITGLAWCYSALSRRIQTPVQVYGLQTPALTIDEFAPETLEELARCYVDEIRKVHPTGPYRLAGWSLGGVIAHAMAVHLQAAGEEIELLCMMDSFAGGADPAADPIEFSMKDLFAGLVPDDAQFGDGNEFDSTVFAQDLASRTGMDPDHIEHVVLRLVEVAVRNLRLMTEYRPDRFTGDLLYFAAAVDDQTGKRGATGWSSAVTGEVRSHTVPVTHWQMTSVDAVDMIYPLLDDELRRLDAEKDRPV